MKTKLLKKIRRRYSITFYPKGNIIYGHVWGENKYCLEDNNDYYRDIVFDTYEEAYNKLKSWIKSDYVRVHNKDRYKGKKLWWK